jgi:hypothetical protein
LNSKNYEEEISKHSFSFSTIDFVEKKEKEKQKKTVEKVNTYITLIMFFSFKRTYTFDCRNHVQKMNVQEPLVTRYGLALPLDIYILSVMNILLLTDR